MKEILQLSIDINHFGKRLEEQLIKKQKEIGKLTVQDIKKGAPVRTGRYVNSIVLEDTIIEKEKIVTAISSDLKVGGNDPKWADYRLAIFIEHGTGPTGQTTYTGRHQPVYRQTPWWYFDETLGCFIFTEGMKATMHWQKGLDKNIPNYLNAIKDSIKEAKK